MSVARGVVAATVVLLLLGAVPGGASSQDGCDWPKYGRELGLSFAQEPACTDITPANTGTLVPDWFFHTPDSVSASPSVVDGVVYVGSWDGTFYALPADPATGTPEPLWTFEVTDANTSGFGRITSSAAVADVEGRRVVVFGGGSTLYVLDAATGEPLASACVDPRDDPSVRCQGSESDIEILSSPAVFRLGGEDRVVVGMDVHNDQGVGRTGLLSFRLRSRPEWQLEPLWKADPETGLTYTADPRYRGHARSPGKLVLTDDPLTYGASAGSGCAGVWSSPSVDLDAELVFFGTSNCTVDAMPDGETGGEGVWAADLRTGELLWSFIPRGVNDLDDDFGASPNLLPGGLVGQGGKDGWYYAFPRTPSPDRDGQQQRVWASHAGQAGHLSTNFAIGGMIGTAAVGEAGDRPAVFATTAISTPLAEPMERPEPDTTVAEGPGRMLSLHAIDATDGSVLWRTPLARPSYGAPTYARGVVFVPSTFDFSIKAFDADTGTLLWTVPLDGPPSSAPAIVGDRIVIAVGTRTTDAEYKAFGGEPVQPVLGLHPLSPLSGVWSFRLPDDRALR